MIFFDHFQLRKILFEDDEKGTKTNMGIHEDI